MINHSSVQMRLSNASVSIERILALPMEFWPYLTSLFLFFQTQNRMNPKMIRTTNGINVPKRMVIKLEPSGGGSIGFSLVSEGTLVVGVTVWSSVVLKVFSPNSKEVVIGSNVVVVFVSSFQDSSGVVEANCLRLGNLLGLDSFRSLTIVESLRLVVNLLIITTPFN